MQIIVVFETKDASTPRLLSQLHYNLLNQLLGTYKESEAR